MLATFFTIYPPYGQDPILWAKRYWDTYGFDYDTWHKGNSVLAWPLGSETSLKNALERDGIEFETFKADVDRMFEEI